MSWQVHGRNEENHKKPIWRRLPTYLSVELGRTTKQKETNHNFGF